MSTYEDLEDAIIDRLDPIKVPGVIEVVKLPETEKEFARPVQGTRVTVSAMGSEFGDVRSTFHVSQESTARIVATIQSNKLRGSNNLYAVEQAIRLLLLGFAPEHFAKMYLVKAGLIQREFEENVWSYSLEFACKGMVVEEAEPETGPLITQITINNVLSGALVVTDDEIDGGFPVTVFEDEYDGGNP